MAQRSLDLIEAMYAAAEAAQPITGRGIGYKLFTAGLIPSMATNEMQRVYRLLKEARERGIIPWEWIVDETRSSNGRQRGPIPPNMPAASRDPIVATSGTSSPSGSKCGARRAPYAACSRQCSTNTRSASASCTGSAAPPPSMTLPRMTTVATDRALCRRLRSVRHVHVGGGFALAAHRIRWRSRDAKAHCPDPRTGARPAIVPGHRISATTRASTGFAPTTEPVLGTRRDGPERSSRLRRAGRSRN